MPTIDFLPFSRLLAFVRTRGPRLARFACIGGLAALIQLGLLHIWIARGWNAIGANAIAFLLAAQMNFALSATVTWGDRRDTLHPRDTLTRRWLSFHGTIFSTALLNQAVFAIARTAMPDLAAAAFGIAAASLVNFIMLDCIIFRTTVMTRQQGAFTDLHVGDQVGSGADPRAGTTNSAMAFTAEFVSDRTAH